MGRSDGEIAEEIAKVISNTVQVDFLPCGQVKKVDDYDAIIAGTSVHASQTVGSFRKFLHSNYSVIQNKPTAIFAVCANMIEDTQENRVETMGWLEKTLSKFPEIKPALIGLFGGAFITERAEYQKLFFLIRKIINAMKIKMIEDYGKSDFRNWEIIRAWAEEVINLFKQQ